MVDLLLVTAGLALLAGGGEALVRGALSAARRLGVSPLLGGLVIVGFGTSAPELVVTVDAALHQQPDIAVGNVVGSNIANILLILGTCALIMPLVVRPLALRRDAVTVVAASVLFVVLTWGGELVRIHAVALLGGLVAYLVWAYRSERTLAVPSAGLRLSEEQAVAVLPGSAWWAAVAVVGGLLLLVAGSRVLLTGAIGMAGRFGVSEALIGLTLVAVGTSLPELAVSVVATVRGHADVAVGNVLGSNIFNLMGILGVSVLLQPLPIAGRILEFDQWVMLAAASVLALFLYTRRRLGRVEGGILMAGYVAYIAVSFV